MIACSAATTTALGTAMELYREKRGLMMSEAAAASGIHGVTWWRIETGRSTPSMGSARAIAALLGIALDDLDDLIHEGNGTAAPGAADGRGRKSRAAGGGVQEVPAGRRTSQEDQNPPTHAGESSGSRGPR